MIIFVTGTGTDVGKTAISTLLSKGLRDLTGKRVGYFKPVQTGPRNQDANWVRHFSSAEVINSKYNFKLAASPDQAYEEEKGSVAEVKVADITASIVEIAESFDYLVVEGAGGLHVPLNTSSETWLDLLADPTMPDVGLVVVASSGLGTLNHTSLTVEALQTRGFNDPFCVLSGKRHVANEKSLARAYPTLKIASCGHCDFTKRDQLDSFSGELATDYLSFLEQTESRLLRSHQQTIADDKKFCWHPFTQHKIAAEPIDVVGAKGRYLYLADGRKVLDGISSWWVNTVGHGRIEVGHAMVTQQQKLDHVLFAGATHKSAADLAKKLVDIAGPSFARVFYSDNGSTAVEVGLKMAFQYQQIKGKKPKRFIALKGSYHGDTFGAMSVAASTGFFNPYKSLFFGVDFVTPVTSYDSLTTKQNLMKELEEILSRGCEDVAGVIIEPLIQGAGGMIVQDLEWTKKLFTLAKENSVPIICDEVFSGLGRVGAHFAFQRIGEIPDIVCTSKGLTGGNLPIAVTIASDNIFSAFLSDHKSDAFLHGHSYTANPIACAASLAALEITENEGYAEKALELEKRFLGWIEQNQAKLGLLRPRALGGILAFELAGSGGADYFSGSAEAVTHRALDLGLFTRPLGNTVYLVPPLSITPSETEQMLEILGTALDVGESL